MAALLLLAAVAVASAAYLVLEELSRGRRDAHDPRRRLDPYLRPTGPERARSVRRPGRLIALLERLDRRLRPRRSEEALARRLLAAGLGGRLGTAELRALELAAAVTLAALGALAGARRGAGTALLLALVLGAAAPAVSGLLLHLAAARRAARIRAELPDTLDLLGVTVRAGLGLDAAMARVAETTTGPLADELGLVLREIRIGESRTRAFERMAERLRIREVTTLVRALVQGEQLGTPLAETLHVQAVEARRRQRAAAEEKANKAAVKMIVPTGLFIFPALFIVILAPAVLKLMETL